MRLRRGLAKISAFLHRGRAEQELAREMDSHLAMLEEEFVRRGMSVEQARFAAKRACGGIEQAKELHRDERSLVWLEQVLQDLRHAVRSLSKSPGFAAVGLLSLAFGIGVNTAIFTLVNGIILKTLPVPNPDRIVQVTARTTHDDMVTFSFPIFSEIRRQAGFFTGIAAFGASSGKLDLDGDQRLVLLQLVSGDYFRVLGARPALGRLLDEEDDRVEGAHLVCVLSFEAWQTYFNGDPHILNRTIVLNKTRLQVVGVAARDFIGGNLQQRNDVWLPTALDSIADRSRDAGMFWLHILARLRPGMTIAQADARLASAGRSITNALPLRSYRPTSYHVRDGSHGYDYWRAQLHDRLLILMGAVTLVLLVACANLANLLLARATERQHEFAIKLSLGISRWRLLRQLLLETFLLAFSGGALAYGLSIALSESLLALFNQDEAHGSLYVAPDRNVLLFTLSACVLTSLIAGLYPAWQASSADAGPALKGGSLHGLRRSVLRRSLILVQVTLAVVLLFGASLFVRSLANLKTANLGYDIDHLLSMEIVEIQNPSLMRWGESEPRPHPALDDVLRRVRSLPTVEAAAFSNPNILTGMTPGGKMTVLDGPQRTLDVSFLTVSPGYLSMMRIPLFRGRDFNSADRPGAPLVAIVNQRLAAQLSSRHDPIGMRFAASYVKGSIEVIGVAGDSIYANIRENPRPIAFLSFDQQPYAVGGGALEIRCRGSLAETEREVREIVKSSAVEYQIAGASSVELMRDKLIAQDRFFTFLSTLFGVFGTVLAVVGIYGLISYSVTRRTREIGIRMSVGAQRGGVLWLFLREATLLVAGGMLIGLPLALALAGFLRKLLYEVSTTDPVGIVATLVLLALGGLLASVIPARRATRVNPVQALRYD